ncbi:MAG: LPXTG cell wall anchor domain-containing protein [Lachnospiraceae bacterium]|nr:LPXTG cell wall anchor domain-containing protein [Lachnospiraceae bacterium]
MRKKILSIVLAATMVFGMATTAFAAPSPAIKGTITKVEAAKDKNGNAVKLEVKEISAANLAPEQVAKVEEVKTTAGLKTVIESVIEAAKAAITAGTIGTATNVLPEELVTVFEEAMAKGTLVVADVKDIVAPADAVFPLEMTIAVDGATAGTKGTLLHLNGTTWEAIKTTFGDGTATGIFDSLSPVAVVLDNSTTTGATTATTTSTATSPKTGENATWAVVAAFVAVAAIGSAYAVKRKRA